MKRIFFVLIVLFSCEIFPQWINQPSGISSHLYSVFFVNESTGWTVGGNVIYKTTNSGLNWFGQYNTNNIPLYSIYFINENIGWAVGGVAQSLILKTTNNGINWFNPTTGSYGLYLISVFFIDQNTGWAIDQYPGSRIIKTTDGGSNWVYLNAGGYTLYTIFFIDSNFGWASGGAGLYNGYIIRTTNGGTSWNTELLSIADNLPAIYFANQLTGWAAGFKRISAVDSSRILKTTNGGLNWILQDSKKNCNLKSMFFINENTGWAVGENLVKIIGTTNGGMNWSIQLQSTGNYLRSVYFANHMTGWAAGDFGTILKTTNGGLTTVNKLSSNIPEANTLYQNFPNPFNPVTSIRFQVPRFSWVKIIVYDILGHEIITLVNEQFSPGTYEVEFDGTNYPSGVFYYTLSTGDFIQTKRMVLIK